MKKVFFFAAVAALLCSCGSTMTLRTARTADFTTSLVNPTIASDLQVDETKVAGNTDADRFTPGKVSKKALEENAVAVALAKVGADMMIQPQFVYQYTRGKLTSVSVTGYPAFYRNFRKVEMPKPCEMKACEKKECEKKECEKKCCCQEKQHCAQVVVYGAEVNNAPAIAPAAAPAVAPKAAPAAPKATTTSKKK